MEPPSIPELDGAAEIYDERKMERVALSKKEDEAKDALIDMMKEHKLTRYETPSGITVEVTAKANVTTKRKKDAEEGDE